MIDQTSGEDTTITMSLFEELTRRNVVKMAVLYLVAAWLTLQIADVLFSNRGAPEWAFGMAVYAQTRPRARAVSLLKILLLFVQGR